MPPKKTTTVNKRKREDEISLPLNYRDNELEYLRIATAAFSFDFSKLEKSSTNKDVLYEFKRFMILKALYKDTSASILSPSAEVDEVWHRMLLYPVDYYNFCNSLLPVSCAERIIDHNPEGVLEGHERLERYNRTIEAYGTFFKETPPE